ncbi:hypothetical protein Q7P37_005510 [Cladosporium fusiforme]
MGGERHVRARSRGVSAAHRAISFWTRRFTYAPHQGLYTVTHHNNTTMALSRTKAASVGSSQWIQKEKEQAGEFVEQEVEEFEYSVRNEMEWLNEHMAEIFSTGAVNFADVFKTPGKLRGKTPRTARKRDALEQRQPLTDIFAPNAQAGPTPAKNTTFYEKVTQFQIAEDGQTTSQQRPLSRSKSPQRIGMPGNTDSGYHGMTEDEMEADTQTDGDTVPSQSLELHNASVYESQPSPRPKTGGDDSEPVSDESFLSAREGDSRDPSKAQLYPDLEDDNATVPDDEMKVDAPEFEDEEAVEEAVEEDMADLPADAPEEKVETEPTEQDLAAEMSHEPSETSSPGRPLERKSSFTFSSLPAREPLTAKRSIGGRNSNMEALTRNSVFAKSVGKSFGVTHDDGENSQDKAEDAALRGKTSAQLLHERISMLGKAKDSRSSKSIPQATYPQLPQLDDDEQDAENDAPEPPPKDGHSNAMLDDEDDDWIAPSKPAQLKQLQPPQFAALKESSRPTMHKKAISTTVIPSPSKDVMQSPSRLHRAHSFDRPSPVPETESTTPVGSPLSKKTGEPVSASKKLWTAFKSARSLFASSAGSSAAAKLESHDSPAGKKSKKTEDPKKNIVKMPGALWSETQFSQSSSRPMSVVSGSPSRKTRSSTESDKRKDKDFKAQQKAEDELEKAREKERQKALKAQEDRLQAERAEAERLEKEQEDAAATAATATAALAPERPRTAESDREDMPPPPPPKNAAPTGRLRAPSRPVRPTREATNAAKAKPAPVNVRVASQLSHRLGQPASQESVSSVKSDSSAPPPPPKTGLRTNSAQANARSSTMPQNNSRVRALEAAARKKEQEEREKQRKADQKRELERKRAAKAEEERRIEQEKKAEEQRKLQESKLAAQRQAERQAAEAKRREQQRFEQQQQRLEQQRQEQQRVEQSAAAKAKAAHELAEAIQRERAEKQPLPRGDAPGTLRQLGQRTVPAPNPAKPPKRILQQEEEEQRPGMQRNPPSYQQHDAKRRRTEDEQEAEQRHSVMAPPKRPSTMRKETLPKFTHGYAHAPPPAAHHSSSMFKSTVTTQHQLQHGQRPAHPSQTVQLSNARIPFAENANPPAAQYYSQQSQAQQGNENGASSKFRTPARAPTSKAPKSAKSAAKSSPMYPNGDNIALPEIMTDSEDEDDEDEEANGGFRAPSWVASPALRDLLTQQQLVDPETVFGAIPDLKMEEVFKGAKNQERLKRFRDRGSSAMWVETGDAVTTAEKQRDMEARERVYKEGGWSYHNRV